MNKRGIAIDGAIEGVDLESFGTGTYELDLSDERVRRAYEEGRRQVRDEMVVAKTGLLLQDGFYQTFASTGGPNYMTSEEFVAVEWFTTST